MKINLFSLLVIFSSVVFAQTKPDMVLVEGGTFIMGDEKGIGESNERPPHTVVLNSFSIAKTETTVLQWKIYCDATGRKMPGKPPEGWVDDHPIVNVTWEDAVFYCDWMTDKLGKIYRLPTEAEWEYAARGGKLSKGFKYSGGHSIDVTSWYKENSDIGAKSVGQKSANELGIYDMSGNVWEWCEDWYGDYVKGPQNNPTGPSTGRDKVLRGGSWYNSATQCRITLRFLDSPKYANFNRGFRLASPE